MTPTFQWNLSTPFYERVERCNLHGLHFQHIGLCRRRAWMYLQRINFAQWHHRVATGTAWHETSYVRDRSTQGLIGLRPDRVDWQKRIVYEHKGTGGAVEAVDNQAAFYALMLAMATGQAWTASVKVVSNKRERLITLDEERLQRLWNASLELETLSMLANVPETSRISLCASCSLAIFCGYD